jgi:trk system potassium uptake protein TrkA
MYAVIVGCGRVGSTLAAELSRAGHSVVVLDSRPTQFEALPAEFSGFKVAGDAAELDVLRRSKMDQADAVIAVTRDDNLNLMVAQAAAAVFGVKTVLARCYDPTREAVYRELGIETVSPNRLAVAAFLARLSGEREP